MNAKLKKNFSVTKKYHGFYTGGCVKVTSDGKYVYTLCDNKVNVVDVTTGLIHVTLAEDEDDAIDTFALSLDDKILVVARRSLRLQHVDLTTNTVTRTWKAIHRSPILTIDLDVTSTLLATGSADSTVKVCDIVNKYYTHNFKVSQGVVSIVKFHPDISRLQLLSVSSDNKIRVWGLKTSKCLHILDKHLSTVTGLHFVDNKTLLSCGRDSIVVLWDLKTYTATKTIPVFEPLESVATFPPNTDLKHYNLSKSTQGHFVTAGLLGQLRVWDSTTAACRYKQDPIICRKSREKEQIPVITTVIMNEATSSVFVVTFDHNILVYDVKALKIKQQMVGYSDEILDTRFLGNNNSHIAIMTNSEQVKVFDMTSWDCTILHGHTDTVLCVDVCNKKHLMATGSKDNTIRLWSTSDMTNIHCVSVLQGHMRPVASIAISSSAKFFLSGSHDCTLKRWDLPANLTTSTDTIKVTATITERAHTKDINMVVLAVNDSLLATASLDKTVKIWKPSDLSLAGVMKGHTRNVWSVQFSPVDKCVVSCSHDGSIKIWSLTDYTCVKTFEGHDCAVLWVSFISAGLQLLSSGSDGLIKLWTIKSNECVQTFDEHDGQVWTIAVGKDMFMSGGSDSTILQWQDVTESERVEALKKQEEFLVMEQELTNLIYEKNFHKAVRLALRLDQPFRLLNIFKQILESTEGMALFHITLKGLRSDQQDTLLRFASEWNKNSKHSHIAQMVISSLFHIIQPQDLIAFPRIRERVEALIPYTERHYTRLKHLRQQTKFVDYSWSCMRAVTSEASERMTQNMDTNEWQQIYDKDTSDDHVTRTNQQKTISTDNAEDIKDVAVAIRLAAQRQKDEQ